MVDALKRANQAVVGVQVGATEGARSAETLGRQREGSGVVIGPDGLILTIGYLMLEADGIQVVTHDGRTLPAAAVAYDVATGFGLIRPLLPLRNITPVPLGNASELAPGTPLMATTGGDGGEVALTQLVSKRAFSGYWEYFIESALFTSPPIDNHSGAPVFNQRGELLGIGSLVVGDASGEGRRLPGNMFVPVDLLKPILAELQQNGITRQSLITLAREDLDIPFVERRIGRTELYIADEVFLCGTGAEVTPVRSVDRRAIGGGQAGPITRRLSEPFEAVVRGRVAARASWLTPVW
jgi:S1-C subfamily serine protease